MTTLLTLAQVTMTDPAVAEPVEELTLSYWELAFKGGWVMIPILLLSVIAVFIFVERYFVLRTIQHKDEDLMNRIKDKIHEGKVESALENCKNHNSPQARMLEKGIRMIGRPIRDVNAALENVGKLEVYKLEKGLPTMATVAGGAPMLGFMGTVMGMIMAFYQMSSSGNNIDVSLLSSGIYTAMITTLAGLLVGIIAYFGYNILVAKVEKVVFNLEATTSEFIDLLNEPVNE